jgi:hypothetical protein
VGNFCEVKFLWIIKNYIFVVKNSWFTPERSYIISRKWLLPKQLKPMVRGYPRGRKEGMRKLKSAINFNAEGKRVILMTYYMPVMWPTSLLATIMVLNALKVHWDQINYCHCLS